MEQFYNEEKENFDKLYNVFVNSKNYGLGAGTKGVYTDEKEGSFEELPDFLSSNGINIGNAQDFLTFVYNTGKGAVRAEAHSEVTDSVTNALKAAAAKLMFDDYMTYG